MGDVAGSGLSAAVTMGRLRTVVRACSLDHKSPADLLSKVDEHIRLFEPGTMATALCATFSPDQQTALVSSAGHPPPIIACPNGHVEPLELHHDLLLGVDPTRPRHAAVVSLPPGSTLCFYTDGLIERRGQSLDAGLDRLCRAMSPGPAEAVARRSCPSWSAAIRCTTTSPYSPSPDKRSRPATSGARCRAY
jgi:phosphoserine phosphatase RsbU/P